MKNLLLLFFLTAAVIAKGEKKEIIAYMVYCDDDITHNYIGVFYTQYFEKSYPAPFDFSKTLDSEAKKFLERYTRDSVIHIDDEHIRKYVEMENTLSGRDFRFFREEWFTTLKEKYGFKRLVVFRNEDVSIDFVGNSKYPIHGYGLYNSAYKNLNFVYFVLKTQVFDKARPKTYYSGRQGCEKNKNLPRITKEGLELTEHDLAELVKPVNDLITAQFEALVTNYEFRNRIIKRFGNRSVRVF